MPEGVGDSLKNDDEGSGIGDQEILIDDDEFDDDIQIYYDKEEI